MSHATPSIAQRFAQIRAGKVTTSTDTNTQPRHKQGVTRTSTEAKKLGTVIQQSISTGGIWRLASHIILVAGVMFVVSAGKIQADSLTNSKAKGFGAASEDQSTMLAAGAILAEQSRSLIADDVKERANTAATQAKLVTTAETFLTKRSPITSGGTAGRTVTNYTIAQGDTISTIAQKFGVTSDTVLWANSLDENSVIKPGSQLVILPVNGLLYTAVGNETLEELANRYQASAALIDSYNQLEGKPLAAGQKLIIPDGVKPAPPKPAATTRLATTSSRSTTTSFRASYGSNGYSYGYCTYYVAGRRSVPSNWGNASQWYYNAIASGYAVGSSPRPGAIAQTSGGWGGYGHVAYVESVSGGMVTVSEMNYNGGWNRVSSRTVPASSFRYIY
ncbi:LysM peptidoglycan-binding domain-containing protein [Candidatus Saccharibacteria bacterium]|nr:LysM peptidoglycan-binding domain-containing protein [Candidatus Saccharibacteria bacterium]